jgi:replication factor A2
MVGTITNTPPPHMEVKAEIQAEASWPAAKAPHQQARYTILHSILFHYSRIQIQSGYGKDTLRPCTIKQILDAQQTHPDADFKIDNTEITQVTFIGQIRNISTQATNITYKLDDGTGTVEVKQWIDPDASTSNADGMGMNGEARPQLTENTYARVWGRLKAFNNKRHVGAHVIRPVTDLNEINHHLLEATAVHLFFTRGIPGAANGQTDQGPLANGAAIAGGAGDGGMSHHGKQMPNLTNIAKRVYQTLLNTPQSNEGLHVQSLALEMQVGVNDAQKGAEELVSHGLIYTTVDDNTWAVLDF